MASFSALPARAGLALCERPSVRTRPQHLANAVVPRPHSALLQHHRVHSDAPAGCAASRPIVACAASASGSNGTVGNGGDSHAGYAVLHDFCMTLPYGTIALLVGVVSFFVGSAVLKSLAVPLAGVGAGTLVLAVLSLKGWKQGKSSAPYTLLTAGLAGAGAYVTVPLVSGTTVGWVAGGLAGLSAAAGLFCLYNVLAGGNPPRKGSH